MKKFLTFFVSALCAVCAWAQGTMTGAELAAMMGSTVYEGEVFGAAQKVYAREDGNIYEQWGLKEESVIVEASAQVTLEGSTYTCPASFTFHIEDGKVTKISVIMSDLIPSLGDITEAEFAELVGDDVYSSTDGVTIIAKNGAIYMVDGEGTETALHDMFDKFGRVGEDFKFSNDGNTNTYIIFHPFGDKFEVSYYENYTELKQSFYVSVDEAELVAAMGDREYVNTAEPWMKLRVENDKVCKVSTTPEGTGSDPLNERYMLTKKGNNTFVFFYGSTEYDFNVSDGKVTKVTYMEEDKELASYIIKSTDPIAQIGETIYNDVYDFPTAFSAIDGTTTVKLLGDIDLQFDEIENRNVDTNITLDLNNHNLRGKANYGSLLNINAAKLTIKGNGIVENTGEDSHVLICRDGTIEINGGTYKSSLYVCSALTPGKIIINNGKFKAPELCNLKSGKIVPINPVMPAVAKSLPIFNIDYNAPVIKGGVFSMDPTVGVAFGYEAVANDDEKTMAEYPYKVVKSDVVPTNAAGLLSVPQAGELNIRAYFTAKIGEFYEYCLVRGECHNINDVYAVVETNPDDVIYKGINMSSVITVPQAFSVKDDEKYLEAGEKYTLFVLGLPESAGPTFKSKNLDGPINQKVIPTELAVIPFIVGVGEINTQTAIEHINADKAQKSIKTIENGKVVIIRGDKKYDLSGREM